MFQILKNKQRGSFMLEVLIVSAIISIAVLSASGVAQKSIYLSRTSLHEAQASMLLEEGAELVKVLRDNDWTNISNLSTASVYYAEFSGGSWSLSTTPSTIGIFSRTIELADVYRDSSTDDIVSSGGVLDSGTKLFTVSVSWNEGGDIKNKTLDFYLADIF